MLDKDFSGPNIDPILLRLSDSTVEPGFVDPRHCLVFWGRPSQKIKNLIDRVQKELLTVAPSKSTSSCNFGGEERYVNHIVCIFNKFILLTLPRSLDNAAGLSTHHSFGNHAFKEGRRDPADG